MISEETGMQTWFLFELAGTLAFAFSGTMVGISRRMDIFGITVLALMTAVGGGMMRDVVCGITPPSVLRNSIYIFVSIACAFIVSFVYPMFHVRQRSRKAILLLYNVSDTIGLAAFTVTGALTGFAKYPDYHFLLPVMLGLITAVGGGMIRDMMARRMPVVLYMDVYAVASVAGGFVLCVLRLYTPLSLTLSAWLSFGVVVLLRFLALHFHWQLYHPRRRIREKR